MMWKTMILTTGIMLSAGPGASSQGYVDQEAVAPLLESQGSLPDVSPVGWHLFEFTKADKNATASLKRLQAHLDSLPGGMEGQRMAIVELSNRVRSKYIIQRRQLLVPDSFPDDFLAYTPYPLEYGGAASIPKLFIIDKYSQTFGAYEQGRLVRWGLISSGRDDDLTPDGRYIFNWKQEYRESSEAPEGEVWGMRWVFNFHGPKGLHVHQYQLPIALPASHGCVRLTESDALWNYNWAEQGRAESQPGTMVIVINHNPVGLPAHWLPGLDGSAVSLVVLPDDPASLPPGTETQSVAGP
jgi:hypothetical protein